MAKAGRLCKSLMTFRRKLPLPAAPATEAECHLYFTQRSLFHFGRNLIQPYHSLA